MVVDLMKCEQGNPGAIRRGEGLLERRRVGGVRGKADEFRGRGCPERGYMNGRVELVEVPRSIKEDSILVKE